MTRSNLYITLTNGEVISCVAESSSAPEQGYIVESLLLPLLSLNDANAECLLLNEHCTMNELRSNATYRYEIDLRRKTIAFFDEIYFFKTDKFRKGENLTSRYLAYLEKFQNEAIKDMFKGYTNEALIKRANSMPDFNWDDEGTELTRRSLQSNGAFLYRMQGDKLVILKDKESRTKNLKQ